MTAGRYGDAPRQVKTHVALWRFESSNEKLGQFGIMSILKKNGIPFQFIRNRRLIEE